METKQKHYKINYNKITICIILLFVLSFSFLFFNIKGKTLDAGQVTVFIDPGHGGGDTGCIQNGYLEKNIDLSISLKVKGILEANGFGVIMRRTDDSGMSTDDIISTANASGANLFVSIHSNSALNPAVQGIETYWSASNTAGGSSQLATAIHNAVVQSSGRPNRGLRSAEFKVIKYTTMPAALIECAFLSNPDEAALLNSEDYQNRVAQGIVNGIRAYVNNAGVSGNVTTASGETLKGDVLVNIDAPSKNQVVSGILNLQGWAIDRSATTTTGITAVHVYDGPAKGQANFIGQATYGIARPDVATLYGKGNLTPSGFNLSIDTSKLAKGTHVLHVYANNKAVGWKYATVTVNVVNDGSAPDQTQTGSQDSTAVPVTQTPATTTTTVSKTAATSSKLILINIDSPSKNSSVGGNFEIAGWAADKNSNSGAGINMVHVYDGPANGPQNMLGISDYGIARPDVASALGNANIANSGFKLTIDGSKLTQGQHTIYVYANNPEIGWKYATLKINVTTNGGGGQSTTATTGGSVSGGTNIVGYVPVSVDQLLRPFVTRGSGQIDRARRLADLYIKWGQAFNIRADIAWAQMCHETGCLDFTGVAKPDWNNFGGIGITGPGVMVTFASEELGVIAHYAHLAWYVYPGDINAFCNKNYDPRHIGAHRFNGDSSLNSLNSRWAPAADYVSKIVYFANQIWG